MNFNNSSFILTQNDQLKDLTTKIDVFKSTNENTMKEKQIKEIFILIARKISNALSNNDLNSLQELFTDRFLTLSECIKAYDWPNLDKKVQETLNRKTLFYYDLLKIRHQFSRRRYSHEIMRNFFENYRKFLQSLGDDQIGDILLTDTIIYRIFEDYLESYLKLIIYCEGNKEKISEDKEDYWDMYLFITEGIYFTSPKEILSMDKKDQYSVNLKNTALFCVYSNSFKSKLLETDVFNVPNNKLFEYILDNDFNGQLLSMKNNFDLMKGQFPIIYYELLIEITILRFIKKEDFGIEDFRENLVDLINGWEFMNTQKKFIRRNYDFNLIKFKFNETIKNLILLHLISCFKNLDSDSLSSILEFINVNPKEFCLSSNFSVLHNLNLPFISEWNMEFSKLIVNKFVSLSKKSFDIKKSDEYEKLKNDLINSLVA